MSAVDRVAIDLTEATLDDPVTAAIAAARDHLVGLQDRQGWWKGELETNVTMDAEDLLLRHFLGILDASTAEGAGRWIRAQQRHDGAWATFYGGPGDTSATVEAYVALRLVGDHPEEAHMVKAASWVRAAGGVAAARVFTRIWLAMVGCWDWEDLPVLPPEIIFLPPSAPLNIYEFGCWARQTIVALSVVMAHRPSRPLPFALSELDGPPRPVERDAPADLLRQLGTNQGRFLLFDQLLHRYERLPRWFLPRSGLRSAALQAAERWIVRRQEADGCWGGIQPPLVYSIIALHLQGYALDHPVLQAALAGMEAFILDDERGRRVEACQSPVWDTALAIIALVDAGEDPSSPPVRRAANWLGAEEVRVAGDWAVRRPSLAPGGWAFEFHNDNYPDIDDTAEVIMALRRAGCADDACRRGVTWTEGMQSRGGGWGAFDVDNDSPLIAQLPLCDFGEVTDPPSADVTAHVVEMLAAEPGADPAVLATGVRWLWSQQETDGSWFGRWGVNHIYGTGAAVPALVAAGVDPADPRLRRALRWLESCQNPDGGWGEDLRSYVDRSWRGRGASTASQTAWALLALIAAGEADGVAARAGVRYLIDTQEASGTWAEPWFTGTGFPWDFSINYHLYRLVFPLTALGRWAKAVRGGSG